MEIFDCFRVEWKSRVGVFGIVFYGNIRAYFLIWVFMKIKIKIVYFELEIDMCYYLLVEEECFIILNMVNLRVII